MRTPTHLLLAAGLAFAGLTLVSADAFAQRGTRGGTWQADRPTHVATRGHHDAHDAMRRHRAQERLATIDAELDRIEVDALAYSDAIALRRVDEARALLSEAHRSMRHQGDWDRVYAYATEAEERCQEAAQRVAQRERGLRTLRQDASAELAAAEDALAYTYAPRVEREVRAAAAEIRDGERALDRGDFADAEQHFDTALSQLSYARAGFDRLGDRRDRGYAPAAPTRGYGRGTQPARGYVGGAQPSWGNSGAACPLSRGRTI